MMVVGGEGAGDGGMTICVFRKWSEIMKGELWREKWHSPLTENRNNYTN